MNQKLNGSQQQNRERLHFARQQLASGKFKRVVLYAGIVAIFGAGLIFQLSALYAQPDRAEAAGVSASPGLNVEISTDNAFVRSRSIIAYEVSYANSGVDQATDVFLTISVPLHTTFVPNGSAEGWDCGGSIVAGTECSFSLGTLAPGDSSAENFYFVVVVDGQLPENVEQIDAEVSISDDGLNGPSEGGQQVDSVSVSILGPGTPVPTLTPTITPTPTPIPPLSLSVEISNTSRFLRPSSSIVYEISYANMGTDEATGVEVITVVPEYTTFVADSSSAGWDCGGSVVASTECSFSLGTLAPGDSSAEDLSFAVVVDEQFPEDAEQLSIEVSIVDDGLNGPSQGGQLVDSISVPLFGSLPVLNVEINTNVSHTQPFDIIVYEISYANLGDNEATGVEVHMTVPEYTTFIAEDSSAMWDCANGSVIAGTECTFQIETLAAGDSGEENLIFAVRIDRDVNPCVEQIDAEVSILDDGLNGPSAGGQQADSISWVILCAAPTVIQPTPRPTSTPKARKSYMPVINQ